jgi:predicted amidohydrolase
MEQGLTLAAIQYVSIKGDIAANAARHLQLARAAAKQGACVALFPELSLTGYEPAIARENMIGGDDARLRDLQALARELDITIVVGAPVAGDDGKPMVGALSFRPDGSCPVYTKQHLHAGENDFFATGTGGARLDVGGEKLAIAVCAEILQAEHAARAARHGASIYAASVLITAGAYATETALLRQYAQTHGMPVMMANHGGTTGGWNPAGRSAIWDAAGNEIVVAPGTGECIVLAQRKIAGWQGWVLSDID